MVQAVSFESVGYAFVLPSMPLCQTLVQAQDPEACERGARYPSLGDEVINGDSSCLCSEIESGLFAHYTAM